MADVGVINISAIIEAFTKTYKLQSQQLESRVADIVYNKTFTGQIYNDTYKSLIPTSAITTGRATGSTTTVTDTGFVTRRLIAETQSLATVIAKKDIVEMAKDPKPEVIMSLISAMNRKRDNVVLAQAIGNVDQKNESTGDWDATALPAGQKIAIDYPIALTDTGLTVEKLRRAKVILDTAEQPKDGRCVVANSEVIDSLLAETEVTSADYNTVKTLVQGEIDTFLGFKFIQCEQAPASTAIVMQKEGVMCGKNLVLTPVDVIQNGSKWGDYDIIVEEQYSAIRREDTAVVEIATL